MHNIVVLAHARTHFRRLQWMLAYASMTLLFGSHVFAAELAPTGVLRAVYNSLNPGDARFDRKTQTIVGPAAELTKALARRLNVPFEIAGLEGAPAVIERVKTLGADIAFVPCDPSMANEVDFSQAYATVRGAGQCIIVAKGGHAKLETVNRFINDVRASGKLRDMLTR